MVMVNSFIHQRGVILILIDLLKIN